MRAATMKERPSFPLMRQTDVQSIYHMQMPRWLFSDSRYAEMGLDAKVAYGDWTLSGPKGFLIPVRNKDGLIQGMKIRLDDGDSPGRKYRWLSSRDLPNGTRSYSWIHVTGDTTKKRAFITEGPLKGDVASFLAHDALFVCVGGVNAIHGLRNTLKDLGVTQVVEAMDMDQMTNPNVRNAILAMRKEVQAIKGLKYTKYTWDPVYKGVDDYLLSRAATM